MTAPKKALASTLDPSQIQNPSQIPPPGSQFVGQSAQKLVDVYFGTVAGDFQKPLWEYREIRRVRFRKRPRKLRSISPGGRKPGRFRSNCCRQSKRLRKLLGQFRATHSAVPRRFQSAPPFAEVQRSFRPPGPCPDERYRAKDGQAQGPD